ncbi:MAG: DUF4011 domain-containing protein [Bacteroidota bacterium]
MTFSKTLIDKNRQSWIARLIDTTRRNNLLFFAPEPTERVFPLDRLGSDALERLMRLESLNPNNLMKEEGEKKTLSSLKQIARRSKSNEEERSIKTLYLARGLFRWPAGDGGKDFCAPALLLALSYANRKVPDGNLNYNLRERLNLTDHWRFIGIANWGLICPTSNRCLKHWIRMPQTRAGKKQWRVYLKP